MGVTYYETFLKDGDVDYFGANGYKNSMTCTYSDLTGNEILRLLEKL